MRITETYMRQWLVKEARGLDIIIQPIESSGTGLGIPDLFLRVNGHDAWMELKIAFVSKKNLEVKLNWRPGQLYWLNNYIRMGGIAYLMVGFDSGLFLIIKNSNIRKSYASPDEINASSIYDGTFSHGRLLYFINML